MVSYNEGWDCGMKKITGFCRNHQAVNRRSQFGKGLDYWGLKEGIKEDQLVGSLDLAPINPL